MSKMDALLPRLKGKILEISIGDEYEELTLNDHVKKVNGVIYGMLEDIVDDFLIVSCYYFDKNDTLHKRGNVVYINTWGVKAFTELNSRGCLNDVFLSSAHSRKMKELLGIDD